MANRNISVFPTPPVRQTLLNPDNTVSHIWLKWFTQVYAQVANVRLADIDYDYQQLATGFTYTYANNTVTLLIHPAGTLAAGTIVLPPNPVRGQIARFSSTAAITSLAVTPNVGQMLVGGATTLAANQGLAYIYNQENQTWFPYP